MTDGDSMDNNINGRILAFNALFRVLEDEAYSNIAFDTIISRSEVNPREAKLAAAIFYGVLERKLNLDYIISKFSKIPIKKIDPKALIILYMGIYQIVYMDRIPDSAAVNECVKLCKKQKLFSASGFVNGILRSVSRSDMPELPNKNKLQYLSIKYSFPKEIISLWQKAYGEEITEKLLEAQIGRPPLCARVNTLKTTSESLIEALSKKGIFAEKSKILENAILIENSGSLTKLPEFKDGLFHIEDISSQICCEVLSPKKGDSVLDVCAAPGGKSVTMAEMMQNEGKLLACDLYPQRLKLIEENAEKASVNIIQTMTADAQTADYKQKFQKVLCDVPCSGFGIIRRKPELRYKSVTGLDTLPNLQYLILCNAAKYVAEGGILIYSTCTLNPKENGENAERFLREHSNFQPYEIKLNNVVRGIDEPSNQLTLFPHTNGTDGFFVSAFVHKTSTYGSLA